MNRYELTDAQWAKIADMLPGKVGDRGRTTLDNRKFINGVLWIIRFARWSVLPETYGNYKSAHKRSSRWAEIRYMGKGFPTFDC